MAELCVLLSSLAGVPIRQELAITGAISQRGEVQAIGGVNEKIEGFFDLCNARGLTGSQGVIVPRANVRHLMVKEEVVAAISEQQFHLWAVETVDEAVQLLTGIEAGERDAKGDYPGESLNGKVEAALQTFVLDMRAFERRQKKEPQDSAARKPE